MFEVNIKEGIIKDYDGREGVIKEIKDDCNNTYMFLEKDTEYDNIKVGDEVLFRAEKVEFYPSVPVKIARFVRKKTMK